MNKNPTTNIQICLVNHIAELNALWWGIDVYRDIEELCDFSLLNKNMTEGDIIW